MQKPRERSWAALDELGLRKLCARKEHRFGRIQNLHTPNLPFCDTLLGDNLVPEFVITVTHFR